MALEELLERADVITLHCGLTEHTRGLVDRRLLARVKAGAILVNVARGQIVESEDVLADALASGRLVGRGARRLSRTSRPSRATGCTPIRARSARRMRSASRPRWNEQVFHSLARDVQSVLAGGLPANVLNPEALTGLPAVRDRARRSIR